MKLGRRGGIALIAAMCAIVLALCLVPIRTFAGEESTAETAVASAAATASTNDSEEGSSSSAGSTTNDAASSAASASTTEGSSSSSSSSNEAAASDSSTSSSNSPATESSDSSDTDESSSDSAITALAAQILASPLTATGGITIQYDEKTEIHYVVDANSVDGRIILYCMNNASHWPHSTPSIPTVPSYTEGYLTPDKFSSQADYEACMNKLLAILYAGYPYNGLNMYQIVDTVTGITEEQFNAMLTVPDVLRTDFPDTIGNEVYSYSDYTNNNTDHLERLQYFIEQVVLMGIRGTTSASGLTADQIESTEFYQAAKCLAWAKSQGVTPLEFYDSEHSGEYYVTEAQAYDATQYAIWAVLGDYGIEYNTKTSSSGDVTNKALAVKLLNYATADQVLRAEPDAANVSISGDATTFTYDPASGTWKTGALKITEGTNYNGMYSLTLPAGVTAQTANGSAVTSIAAGTSFYLVSSTKPTSTDMKITAADTLTWLQEYRQYSPSPENYTASDGKNFQHMIGAVIKQKPISAELALKPAKDGNLTVSKKVVGETDSTTEFTFTVKLSDTSINGTYGDMTFTDGVATVTLMNGESATAEHLPAGTTYSVTEADNSSYISSSEKTSGAIADGKTETAAFTNTRLYSLTVGKAVSGKANGSSEQAFPIVITLKDAAGAAVNGSYSYTGSVAEGSSATAPAAGTLAFTNGTATISLKAGQKITLAGIPSGYSYEVSEDKATDGVYDDGDADHTSYSVTGTGSGTLDRDTSVTITNTVRTGSLTVTKHVTKEVNPTSSFRITVTLSGAGTGLSGAYGGMTFTNGTASFDLKDNESVTATDLPEGTTYTVEENSYNDYTTTYDGNDGTIDSGTTSTVTVTNERKPTTLPLSGSDGVGPTYLAGVAALAGAAIWMHIRRSKLGKGGDGRD